MKIHDIVGHALGNLRRQRLRTTLTTSGVAIGVFTTAIMMAFPAGVSQILASKLDRQELLTTMFVIGKRVPRTFPTSLDELRRFQIQQHEQKSIPLDDELVEELKKVDGVLAVYPDVTTLVTCEIDQYVELSAAWFTDGFPPDAITPAHRQALLAGAYWHPSVEEGVCVLPSQLLPLYGIPNARDAIGKKVFLSGILDVRRYRFNPPLDKPVPEGERRRAERPEGLEAIELEVIGVYDSDQFGILGNRIQMPQAQAKRVQKLNPYRKPRVGQYQQLILKAVDRQSVDRVRADLDQRQLGTIMTTDALKVLNVIFTAIEAGLGLFGTIALFVSLFGIANTMVMAVLERTREIGILKALGGRDADVWRAFVCEAGAIGFLGGAAGVLVALGACFILNAAATRYLTQSGAQDLEVFHVSPLLGGGLILFATSVSVLAGLYPAWRASRLDPVEALRRE